MVRDTRINYTQKLTVPQDPVVTAEERTNYREALIVANAAAAGALATGAVLASGATSASGGVASLGSRAFSVIDDLMDSHRSGGQNSRHRDSQPSHDPRMNAMKVLNYLCQRTGVRRPGYTKFWRDHQLRRLK